MANGISEMSIPDRNQLERMVGKNYQDVISLENLYRRAGVEIPAEIIDVITQGSLASSRAFEALSVADEALQLVQGLPVKPPNPNPDIESLRLDLNPSQFLDDGRLQYNPEYKVPIFRNENQIDQNIGIDGYSIGHNDTGGTLSAGKSVYSVGTITSGIMDIDYFIADNTINPVLFLGVIPFSIPNGNSGLIVRTGEVSNIDTSAWSVGDFLYCDPNSPGSLTNTKPQPPDLVVPLGVVTVDSASVGKIFLFPTIDKMKSFACYLYASTLTAVAINTEYLMDITNTNSQVGFSIGTPVSRIVIENSGQYHIDFSAHAENSGLLTGRVWVYLKLNGADITRSAISVAIPTLLDAVISRSFNYSFAAGDYIELAWGTDDVGIQLTTIASNSFAPAVTSASISISQID